MNATKHTQRQWFKSHVQTLLSLILLEPAEPDSDGDFLIHGDTARGWVRADTQKPWGVQIFVVAASGVPVRAATLREINEINGHEVLVKVALHSTGVVMVTYRLLADAVTKVNLAGALSRVILVADEIGPILTAVHGGETPLPLTASASDL